MGASARAAARRDDQRCDGNADGDDAALADVTRPGDDVLAIQVSPTEITILVGAQRLVVTGNDLSLRIDGRDAHTRPDAPSTAPTPDAAERAVLERFHGRLRLTETGCWEWTGSRSPKGYGLLQKGHTERRVHRVAWELAHGPIPDGLHVLHLCHNPPCCRPTHLTVGTPRLNAEHSRERRRKLSPEQIQEARSRHEAGESFIALGRRYGVHSSTISRLLKDASPSS